MLRVFATALFVASLTSVMVSCGGESFEGDEDGGSGGSGNSGNAAGNPSRGGSTGKGGASSGGTDAGGSGPVGGSVGTAGTGSGGAPSGICSLPAESGNCNAYIPSFFHNPDTGVCEPFVYGGCGGNDNRFDSVEACQAACSGGTPDLDSCQSPQECVLVSPHCCGACDGTVQDYVAVSAAGLEAFQAAHLCPDIACEPCPPNDPTIANYPYITATCRNGQCVPIDIREEGVTDCQTSDECFLRLGLGCCEGCGGESELTALSDGTRLIELVCGDDIPPCPACAPVYPSQYGAVCDAGRCTLAYVMP
ncbi:MAG TPA: BPTI/Kunitz domain-containing protein [Polyangiaceae bacterium]|nr:BPTI/Kunitz domain-containing protein [Polyangiaceae bacterium]